MIISEKRTILISCANVAGYTVFLSFVSLNVLTK